MSGKGPGKGSDKDFSWANNFNLIWPFFVGSLEGGIGKPFLLTFGALRTVTWLGVNGEEARNNVILHNYLSGRLLRHGFNYARHSDVDPTELADLWPLLPQDAQSNIVEWGAKSVGHFVGGSMVQTFVSGKLVKRIPMKFLFPGILFLNCQGFMASIWKDHWGGGPGGGMGGGGGGITAGSLQPRPPFRRRDPSATARRATPATGSAARPRAP